jgi:hypothetical protein
MPMTRPQYDELRKGLDNGRRVVYFEGRSAASVAELNWIATEVYGLDVTTAAPKATKPAAPAEPAEVPQTPQEPKTETKKADEPKGEPESKPVNLARANLETLRKVATEKGLSFAEDATRGQLLDLISKADKGD